MARTILGMGPMYAPGRVVKGDYDVVRELGRGGMGAVYEVTRNGNTYALKTLFAQHIDQPGYKERFEREARLLSELKHPNIVQILDYNVDDVPFLVMERLLGTDLTHRIKQAGFLTFGQSLEILTPIVDALELAHNRKPPIVHRDLKPDNIFLCDDGTVKLLDFGIAKILKPKNEDATVLTMAGSTMGTMNYMSPEQARGEIDQIDQRTDVFALGAILHQMLSGAFAFSGKHEGVVLSNVMYNNPTPLAQIVRNVPQGVQEVIDHALAKDKSDRYPTAARFLTDLQRIDQGTQPVKNSANMQPAPRTKKHSEPTQTTLGYSRTGIVKPRSASRQRRSRTGLYLFLGALAVAAGTASYYTNTPPQFRRFIDSRIINKFRTKSEKKPTQKTHPKPMEAKPKKKQRPKTRKRSSKRRYNRRGSRRR